MPRIRSVTHYLSHTRSRTMLAAVALAVITLPTVQGTTRITAVLGAILFAVALLVHTTWLSDAAAGIHLALRLCSFNAHPLARTGQAASVLLWLVIMSAERAWWPVVALGAVCAAIINLEIHMRIAEEHPSE